MNPAFPISLPPSPACRPRAILTVCVDLKSVAVPPAPESAAVLLDQLIADGTLQPADPGLDLAGLPARKRVAVRYQRQPVVFLLGLDAQLVLNPAADRLRAAGWLVWGVGEPAHVRMALTAVDHAVSRGTSSR